MALPQTLTDINIFVEGVGHLGTSTKITLPKLEKLKETQKFGGFERSVNTGIFKELSAEITLGEYSKTVFEAMVAGDASGLGVNITIKGSMTQSGKRKPILATLRGHIDIEDGDMEAGKMVERKLTMNPNHYSLTIDGKEECNLDTDNMIAVISGTDYLATLRSHIQ